MIRKGLALALCCASAWPVQAEDKVLNLYTWPDYVPASALKAFSRQTGIRVNVAAFDTPQALQATLEAGGGGYDVVFPSAAFLGKHIQAGFYQPLARSRLGNFRYLDPAIMGRLSNIDEGNRFAVPYMFGTNGIGYNVRAVKQALGDLPMPANEWDLLFKPQYASRLAKCGISLVDSPVDLMPIALRYLGRYEYSSRPEDLTAVQAMLEQVRPHIRSFDSEHYLQRLAAGELCAVYGYSGELTRIARADKAKALRYVIPRGGSVLWVDTIAVPRNAPHPENAHRFLNFLMDPAVIAAISNEIGYVNANLPARGRLDDALRNDPNVLPDAATLQRLVFTRPLPVATQRAWAGVFERFKEGR